jgi:pilus assembly protein Flp/PilA
MPRIALFLKNDSGITTMEYGLIATGVSVAVLAIFGSLGIQLHSTFFGISTYISPKMGDGN